MDGGEFYQGNIFTWEEFWQIVKSIILGLIIISLLGLGVWKLVELIF